MWPKQYENAVAKDNVAYYDAEGAKAVQAKNWQRAVMILEKAIAYQPDDQARQKKLDELKKTVAGVYCEEATNLTEAGQLSEATKKLDLARTFLPSLPNDSKYKTLQKIWRRN